MHLLSINKKRQQWGSLFTQVCYLISLITSFQYYTGREMAASFASIHKERLETKCFWRILHSILVWMCFRCFAGGTECGGGWSEHGQSVPLLPWKPGVFSFYCLPLLPWKPGVFSCYCLPLPPQKLSVIDFYWYLPSPPQKLDVINFFWCLPSPPWKPGWKCFLPHSTLDADLCCEGIAVWTIRGWVEMYSVT